MNIVRSLLWFVLHRCKIPAKTGKKNGNFWQLQERKKKKYTAEFRSFPLFNFSNSYSNALQGVQGGGGGAYSKWCRDEDTKIAWACFPVAEEVIGEFK